MGKNGIIPTIDTYNNLLLNCFISGNFEAAEVLKEEITDTLSPVSPNINTLSILIQGLGLKFKKLSETASYNEKLFADFDNELMNLISFFEQRYIYLDVVAQNTILASLVLLGRLPEAWNQYVNMRRLFTPDYCTFFTILKGIHQTPDIPVEWLDTAFIISEEAKLHLPFPIDTFDILPEHDLKFIWFDIN